MEAHSVIDNNIEKKHTWCCSTPIPFFAASMLSLEKEATTQTPPTRDDDAVLGVKETSNTQDHMASRLGGSRESETALPTDSHTEEAETTRASLYANQQAKKMHELGQNDVDDHRQSSGTQQYEPSPSDDVSLNIGGAAQEDDADMEIRRHDEPGADERRVVFLPPPRVSPVFVPPRSSYPVGPPPIGSAYGTPPVGQIGVHYPREVVRIERDYSGGDLVQFYPLYPIELEGRITPTQWLDTVNGINEILMSAHSLKRAALDHIFSALTLYISSLIFSSHYDKEMSRLRSFIEQCNQQLYHSQGLNILWPRPSGFLFMEIEYY